MTDLRRLDNLAMIDSQSISFEAVPELSLPERISLVASPATEILPLKAGNAMGLDAAEERVVRELERFFRTGPFEFDFTGDIEVEGTAALIIDSEVPILNMIIWEFDVFDSAGNVVTVTLDDETGVILKMIYRRWRTGSYMSDNRNSFMAVATDEELHSAAQSLADMMADYYRALILLADYEFSGSLSYYRADLYTGEAVVPMFGVVRAISFTINERPPY